MRFNCELKVIFAFIMFLCSLNISSQSHQSRSGVIEKEFLTNHLLNNEIADEKVQPNSALAESLQSTFQNFKDLIENLLISLLESAPEITHNTEKLLIELSSRITESLELINKKFHYLGNDFARLIFLTVQEQLTELKNELQQITQQVDNRFDWAVTHLNESLMNHTESIDSWASNVKHQLRFVNDTRLYQESCRLIDDFIVRSTERLQSCCNITMKPMRALCRNASSLVAKALRVLAEVMDRMQACLEDRNSYLDYLIPCIDLAFEEIGNLILNATELRHQMSVFLPTKILYSKFCIAFVLVEIEQGQGQVESDLSRKNV